MIIMSHLHLNWTLAVTFVDIMWYIIQHIYTRRLDAYYTSGSVDTIFCQLITSQINHPAFYGPFEPACYSTLCLPGDITANTIQESRLSHVQKPYIMPINTISDWGITGKLTMDDKHSSSYLVISKMFL